MDYCKFLGPVRVSQKKYPTAALAFKSPLAFLEVASKAAQAPCFPLHSALIVVYILMTSLVRATYQAWGPVAEPKFVLSRSGAGREARGGVVGWSNTHAHCGWRRCLFLCLAPQLAPVWGGGSLSALLLLSLPLPFTPSPPTPSGASN